MAESWRQGWMIQAEGFRLWSPLIPSPFCSLSPNPGSFLSVLASFTLASSLPFHQFPSSSLQSFSKSMPWGAQWGGRLGRCFVLWVWRNSSLFSLKLSVWGLSPGIPWISTDLRILSYMQTHSIIRMCEGDEMGNWSIPIKECLSCYNRLPTRWVWVILACRIW